MAMFDGTDHFLNNLRAWEDIVARAVEVLAPSRRIAAYVAVAVGSAGLGCVVFALNAFDRRAALAYEQGRLNRELRELRQEQTHAATIEQQHGELTLAVANLHAELFTEDAPFDAASAVTRIDDLARSSGVAVDRIAVRESSRINLSIEARSGFAALAAWVRGLAESELVITYEEFRLARPAAARPEDRGLLLLTATIVVHRPGDET